MPTHDEQRVRNSHCSSITRNDLECPVNVRHVDGAQRHIRRHDGDNTRVRGTIPAPCCSRWPARGTAGAVSALPDPAERPLGRGLRQRLMLAVAPGAAGALLVVALPARDADHALYCPAFAGCLLGAQQSGCDRMKGAAALQVDVVVWPQARTRLL